MAGVNKVFLLGNLTRDPEVVDGGSGGPICKFGLATNRTYKKGDNMVEEATFVEITVFGNQGENCAKFLGKGRQVHIEGRLHYHSWENDNGEKRSKLDVVADNVQFLGKRDD